MVLLVHRVEEVTELIRAARRPDGGRARVLEAELYTRARELQELNERLRQAHAREREVALALQEAMLPARRQVGSHRAAVRYRPAVGALNVCGDWYDLVDLVGGHRRRCLGGRRGGPRAGGGRCDGPAAQRAQRRLPGRRGPGAGPGRAGAVRPCGRRRRVGDRGDHLHRLRPTAPSPTAAPGIRRPCWSTPTAGWSSSTRPPTPRWTPAPTRSRGRRPATTFTAGATLALYTDGLVERRREDIDTGLARLADSLARHRGRRPRVPRRRRPAGAAAARRRHRRHGADHRAAVNATETRRRSVGHLRGRPGPPGRRCFGPCAPCAYTGSPTTAG